MKRVFSISSIMVLVFAYTAISQVTSPAYGDTYHQGDQVKITWEDEPGRPNYYDIVAWSLPLQQWITIASSVNSHIKKYQWTVPIDIEVGKYYIHLKNSVTGGRIARRSMVQIVPAVNTTPKSRVIVPLAHGLVMFPNPASVNFMVTAEESVKLIQIWDMYGRLVNSRHGLSESTYHVDCSTWQPGTYLVQCVYENMTKETRKVLVVK